MEIEQFAQFRAAAHHNHLGRAAEALGITQSALSQTIRRLEQRYGLRFFDRIGRTIQLNATGKVLLDHVERTLSAYDDASRAMRELASRGRTSIALGYFGRGGRSAKPIPYLIRRFQEGDQTADFSLVRAANTRLFAGLRDGSIDLCFTSRASEGPPIVSWLLWREELFVYVSATNPLASKTAIDLADLADEPIVAMQPGSDLRAIMDDLFQRAGVSARVVFEGQSVLTLQGVVAANIGVALAPQLDLPEDGSVVALRVRSPQCFRPIYMAYSSQRLLTADLQNFIDCMLAEHDATAIGLISS
jgi:LysR family transcriptional activator of glutamate synthase operon